MDELIPVYKTGKRMEMKCGFPAYREVLLMIRTVKKMIFEGLVAFEMANISYLNGYQMTRYDEQ
jgi:hypothetical protein